MERISFRIGFTMILVSVVYSLEKNRRMLLIISGVGILVEWASVLLHLPIITGISRSFKAIFFLYIVFSLIHQIGRSKEVGPASILEAISGYLLLGIVFSSAVSIIIFFDPSAFNFPIGAPVPQGDMISMKESLYFSFVTLATLGYGDIVPLEPYSRSLATFIAITGQLYIAIIVALLVGKFVVIQQNRE